MNNDRFFLRWLGTRTFIANSTIAGLSSAWFFLQGITPVAVLILVMWALSLITWSEYRAALKNL